MKTMTLIKFVMTYSMTIEKLIGNDANLLKFVYEMYLFEMNNNITDPADYSIGQSVELYYELRKDNLIEDNHYVTHDNLY